MAANSGPLNFQVSLANALRGAPGQFQGGMDWNPSPRDAAPAGGGIPPSAIPSAPTPPPPSNGGYASNPFAGGQYKPVSDAEMQAAILRRQARMPKPAAAPVYEGAPMVGGIQTVPSNQTISSPMGPAQYPEGISQGAPTYSVPGVMGEGADTNQYVQDSSGKVYTVSTNDAGAPVFTRVPQTTDFDYFMQIAG